MYKILKLVHPDTGISSDVYHEFVRASYHRTSRGRSVSYGNKKSTISSAEVQTFVGILLPGQLGRHTISKSTQAVARYPTRWWWMLAKHQIKSIIDSY